MTRSPGRCPPENFPEMVLSSLSLSYQVRAMLSFPPEEVGTKNASYKVSAAQTLHEALNSPDSRTIRYIFLLFII